MPPLAIFPEGTVSNGKVLLTFKRGSFFTNYPVKVCCIKYEYRPGCFRFYNGAMNDPELILMYFSRFDCKGITVYEFEELFDPTYLNVDTNDEDGWKVYAERVRVIMGKCLGIPPVEHGFRTFQEHRKNYYYPILNSLKTGKKSKE